MNKVAFLGIGAMGERMARNLLRAGYQLAVFNRSHSKTATLRSEGATVYESPRDAAAVSDIVISMVTDDSASRHVWLDARSGALAAVGKGKTCIEMSTVTPAWVRDLASRVEASGGAFVEAPVIGSRPQAEAGQLVVLAAGEPKIVAQVGHVFAAISAATRHLGPVGNGATAKLAVNFLFATQVAAMAELLVLMRKNGMRDNKIADLMTGLPVTSPAAAGALKQMFAGSYAPMFPIDLVIKDLRYFAGLATTDGSSTPVADAVRGVYELARTGGFGADNIHGVVQTYIHSPAPHAAPRAT